MKTAGLAWLAALLAALLLGACAAPAQHTTWLTLPPRLEAPTAQPLDPARVLQIGRLTIPEYLSARSARYRADDSSLAPWPGTAWAERLEVALTRDLAAALRKELPGWQVCEDLCPTAAPSHRMNVELTVLEHVRSRGELQAQARWSWQAGRDTLPVAGQRSGSIKGLADTPQAGAVAMAVWIDMLAGSIAAQLPKDTPAL